jgi:hypothetical protein
MRVRIGQLDDADAGVRGERAAPDTMRPARRRTWIEQDEAA